jgi:hypothetical protein
MSLETLADNLRTDKNTTHSYLPLYQQLLISKKGSAKNVLEIGIWKGGSIKLWHEFFTNATIYGLDIMDYNEVWDVLKNNEKIVLHTSIDAYEDDFINKYFTNKKFDFIIDDGPHTLESMKKFIKSYSPLMEEDGIFIIEDIPCWEWIDILKNEVLEDMKPFIKVYDLRCQKNRYDDIVFVIDKSHKTNKITKKYEHYLSIPTEIDIDNTEIYNIHAVYYINCLVNKNYMDWLTNQLNLITYDANIHIVATISKVDEIIFIENVKKIYPNVMIDCYHENEFEYRGILKVWEIGQIHNKKNDILLYFHSKGISRSDSYNVHVDKDYNIILKDIDKIKEIFTVFPSIDKVGYLSGGCGWIWYNFWYARGSYINQVEKPIKTDRRHYYEDWLGRKVTKDDKICQYERCNINYYENTLRNCYSFHTDTKTITNIGTYYSPDMNVYLNFT